MSPERSVKCFFKHLLLLGEKDFEAILFSVQKICKHSILSQALVVAFKYILLPPLQEVFYVEI